MAAESLRIGFAGAGRVATVLAPRLHSAGFEVRAAYSARLGSAEALAKCVPGCVAVRSLEQLAAPADVIFLTVPDDAIAEVASRVPWRPGMGAVHCSGATAIDALAPAEVRGGFHPLQTFATPDTELAGITVAIEASGWLLATLQEMAARLGCVPLRLPEGSRPLYHASGAFGHNYVVTLFAQAIRLWGLLGFTEHEAMQALLPLARTSLANIERLGAAGALTGPIVRGDAGTIRRHLEALEANAPDLLPIYRALGAKSVELSHLEPAVAAEIEAILNQEKESQPCA